MCYHKEAISWELDSRRKLGHWEKPSQGRWIDTKRHRRGRPHFPRARALEWEGRAGKFPLKFWPLQAQSRQHIKGEIFKSDGIYLINLRVSEVCASRFVAPGTGSSAAFESGQWWVGRSTPQMTATGERFLCPHSPGTAPAVPRTSLWGSKAPSHQELLHSSVYRKGQVKFNLHYSSSCFIWYFCIW